MYAAPAVVQTVRVLDQSSVLEDNEHMVGPLTLDYNLESSRGGEHRWLIVDFAGRVRDDHPCLSPGECGALYGYELGTQIGRWQLWSN